MCLDLTVVGYQHRQQIHRHSLLCQRDVFLHQQRGKVCKCLLSAQRILAIHYRKERYIIYYQNVKRWYTLKQLAHEKTVTELLMQTHTRLPLASANVPSVKSAVSLTSERTILDLERLYTNATPPISLSRSTLSSEIIKMFFVIQWICIMSKSYGQYVN